MFQVREPCGVGARHVDLDPLQLLSCEGPELLEISAGVRGLDPNLQLSVQAALEERAPPRRFFQKFKAVGGCQGVDDRGGGEVPRTAPFHRGRQ